MLRAFSIALGIVVLSAGCASKPELAPPRATEELEPAHPLLGRSFDLRSGEPVSFENVVDALAEATFVLLGEKHDNPEHHRGQARFVDALVDRGRKPALVFEMIDRDQGDALEALAATPREKRLAEGKRLLRFEERGWISFDVYEPIFVAAFSENLPLHPGNLEKETLRGRYKKGLRGLKKAERFGVHRKLPRKAVAELRQDILEAHCGHGDEAMLNKMVAVQETRDAFMAMQLAQADRAGSGAVLIAGAQHVRRDRAVPFHLRDYVAEFGRDVAVVAFVEVQDGKGSLEDYEVAGSQFDYVVFTEAVDQEDPCEKFAEQVEKIAEQERRRRDGDAQP